MKTSSKLIAVAAFLILVSLLVYNYQLKAEYASGRYKNPYRNFVTLKLKDFDAVDINSTTAANVKLVQGPFSVRIDSAALEYVNIKQQGNRLKINADFVRDFRYNYNPYIIVISCPKLSEVTTNAAYIANRKQVIDTMYSGEWNMRQNLVEGFTQDSLSVHQTYGSAIIFSGNHIRAFNAVTGTDAGSGPKITILDNNKFQSATIDILNKSQLQLNGNSVQNLKYHLADSARMITTGAAQTTINNSKPLLK
ncbi:MAG TPA: hypothetical protein VK668_22230 [Mucilaginibacter sp.]|nr:hypothetical protein [Mucilaginibacter sp.]